MKNKRLILCAILLLSLGLIKGQAQEAVPTSGGDASGGGGTVSYSVGQIVYSTNTGTNGSITQGVQQPYEISIITGLEDSKEINLSFFIYPNPTTDYLKLNIGNYKMEGLSYQLYDINGKLLENNKTEEVETTISMKNLAASSYFLKVIENNNEIKTFKIIKN